MNLDKRFSQFIHEEAPTTNIGSGNIATTAGQPSMVKRRRRYLDLIKALTQTTKDIYEPIKNNS